MSDNFISKKYYFLTFVALLIFVYVMQNINKVEYTMESFIDDQSIIDLLAKNDCFVPNSLKKIDWHDYDLIQREHNRRGLGEHGQAVWLKGKYQSPTMNLYRSLGLNELVSNKISLSRALPDVRHPACMNCTYIESLPSVSIIIPFHNEHMITLIRTVRSVLNRSPPQLIKEILLVDDVSNLKMLEKNIKNYVAKYENKIKLLKLLKYSGNIRAKLHGAKEATGDVLVFLDAHCEVNVNWLPPLLEPIALDYHTVMCPLIDKIDDFTFEYKAVVEYRGGFDWSLNFKQMSLLREQERKLPEPYESPVMAGGIFAISRIYFWELGGYDPGLHIWGGDQFELSFKVWLCGGRILIASCSRVGHVMHQVPLFLQYGYGDFVRRNILRVANVWMDDYIEKVLKSESPNYYIDSGDISQQKALRQRLNCKPFSWFMSQVVIVEKIVVVDSFPLAEGQVRPIGDQSYCVDADFNKLKLSLAKCDLSKTNQQSFVFTYKETIKSKGQNLCWDLMYPASDNEIYLKRCHDLGRNQLWRYESKTLQIIQKDRCLDRDLENFDLYVKPCNEFSNTQQWVVDYNILF
ncbi:polypeptide N-acetylgalactosaminyltransferase 10-like [Plodia interpunctella]|uniref:polypeptide N-acetylgalactosaminyltransferase 10-like n=1 Tax=Plodia interpunctella TaxID=58824 RepID=UPI002368DB64|nr:polypeptide N-acetylgalactosaminyltransferase 10-like [Plodia interpunctella]